jgi:hypothetical protein
MVIGSSYSVSNIGEDNLAIHHEISMFQKGSVQKAVRYLFDKSSSIVSFSAQSSGIMQSSMTSGLLFSKHPVSKMLQVSNVMKSQIFFIFFIIDKELLTIYEFKLIYQIQN